MNTDTHRLSDDDQKRLELFKLSPIPVSQWESQGNVWPTVNGWYNMLRPENLRYDLVDFGVVSCVNGRWVIFPDKWQLYVAQNHRPRNP